MKRLLADFKKEHPRLETIFIEDALSAKGPYLRHILGIGAHFIVNVNPTGNPTLFDWLKGIPLEKKTVRTKRESIELQFCNGIPLNDANHATSHKVEVKHLLQGPQAARVRMV